MDSQIELIINGGITGNTTASGIIDLYPDEVIQMNISIANIKDITQRNTTFTQNFTVPGTANNNTLFNYIFEIGIDSQFNPKITTTCQLLVDTIPVLNNGVLQLTDILVDDQHNISYELTIFDNAGSFVDDLGSFELTDLDFSALNHTWVHSAVTATWTGTNQPYFYGLIDYGYDLNLSDLNTGTGLGVGQIYPSTQAKTIVDKIFAKSGYTYTSDFFNSTYFKNLYIPYNGNTAVAENAVFCTSREFQAAAKANTGPYTVSQSTTSIGLHTYYLAPIGVIYPKFNDTTTYPNFDTGGLYTISGPLPHYTADLPTAQIFSVNLYYNAIVTGSAIPSFLGLSSIDINYYRSGYASGSIPYYTDTQLIYAGTGQFLSSDSSACPLNGIGNQYGPLQAGEVIYVGFVVHPSIEATGNGSMQLQFQINAGSNWLNTVSPTAIAGSFIEYNIFVPKKIKQIDFMNSLITMHNLYVIPDKTNPKNLIIEPRDVYYSRGSVLDWSNKLDLNQGVQQQLLSEEQNNRIVFSYSADKDFYNDNYLTSTNEIFGAEYVYMNNDFTKDDQNINVIFSPTPSVAVIDSNLFVPPGITGGTANDFVIPKIGKLDSSNHFQSTDFNIRILQKNTGNTISISESWIFDGTTETRYPYLGMLDHPFSGTSDLGFGTVNYEYYTLPYITPNNLVNKYYANYLNQIIDPNGKLITAEFYLTPSDIQGFNLNDTIFVDGLSSNGMGAYFLVNSIVYTPTRNGTSTVELIQVPELLLNLFNTKIPYRQAYTNNSIVLGGGTALSTNSIAIGPNTIIGANSNGSFALGYGNIIGGTNNGTLVMGSGNTVAGAASNSTISGLNNVIGNNSRTTVFGHYNSVGVNNLHHFIVGHNNTIPDVSGATTASTSATTASPTISGITIFGNNNIVSANSVTLLGVSNYTATTSNTVVVPNIQFSTSAGTINGVNVTTIVSGSSLWSASTGINSIVQSNANNIATQMCSYAEGSATTSNENYSHSEGTGTVANGEASHAEGIQTSAAQQGSHSEGIQTTSNNTASHSEGQQTTAGGVGSHAEGRQTTAGGQYSHSEGFQTLASGVETHAEGTLTTASGNYSHAEGYFTKATGDYSHAEGLQTIAGGDASHAEGGNTIASGDFSHTEGSFTTASAQESHAGGSGAISSHNGEWSRSTGGFAAGGLGQYGYVDFQGSTTNATPTEIFLGGGIERFTFPLGSNAAYSFIAYGLAQDTSFNCKEWLGSHGLIKSISPTVSIVGTFTMTSTNGDVALSTASVSISADNTNKAIICTVTGVAATTINWYITLTYAKINN